jgi:hypothetical protein
MKGNDQLDWKNKIKSFRRNFFPFGSVLFRKPHTVEREKKQFSPWPHFHARAKTEKEKKNQKEEKTTKNIGGCNGWL